jgi:hypothetical protein
VTSDSPPTGASPPSADLRRQVVLGAAIVTFLLVIELLVIGGRTLPQPTIDRALGPAQNRAEALIWGMDGKAFFRIATDPTFADTDRAFGGDQEHAAYRSSRPLLGWLAWAASGGGHRPAVGWALLALEVAALAALVAALGTLASTVGGGGDRLLLALGAPGVVAALLYPGVSEPLGVALALWGAARWLRGDAWVAVAAFGAAALCRETMLLIPFALALAHLVGHRRLRGATPLLVPPAVYLAWVMVVRARVGAWPSSGGDQLTAPFAGLVGVVGSWGPMEWASLAITIAATWSAWRWGTAPIRWIVGVHVAFASCMSELVWADWWAFGRLTLPLVLVGVAVLPATSAPASPSGVERSASAPVPAGDGRT